MRFGWTAWTVVTLLLYLAFHEIATWQRGYEAVGGELLLAVVPLALAVMLRLERGM